MGRSSLALGSKCSSRNLTPAACNFCFAVGDLRFVLKADASVSTTWSADDSSEILAKSNSRSFLLGPMPLTLIQGACTEARWL